MSVKDEMRLVREEIMKNRIENLERENESLFKINQELKSRLDFLKQKMGVKLENPVNHLKLVVNR